LPTIPVKSNKSGKSASLVSNNNELMSDFAYLVEKTKWTHDQILNLPHGVFLSYLKHFRIMDLMKTKEGQEYLEKARKYNNPRKHADLSAIRSLTGYNQIAIKGGED
jgi:hypothetical protein